jgi:hypothetical protein
MPGKIIATPPDGIARAKYTDERRFITQDLPVGSFGQFDGFPNRTVANSIRVALQSEARRAGFRLQTKIVPDGDKYSLLVTKKLPTETPLEDWDDSEIPMPEEDSDWANSVEHNEDTIL